MGSGVRSQASYVLPQSAIWPWHSRSQALVLAPWMGLLSWRQNACLKKCALHLFQKWDSNRSLAGSLIQKLLWWSWKIKRIQGSLENKMRKRISIWAKENIEVMIRNILVQKWKGFFPLNMHSWLSGHIKLLCYPMSQLAASVLVIDTVYPGLSSSLSHDTPVWLRFILLAPRDSHVAHLWCYSWNSGP